MKFKKGDIIVDDLDQVYILHDDFEPNYKSFNNAQTDIRNDYTIISYVALFSLYRYKKCKPPKYIFFEEPGNQTITIGKSFHLANKHIIKMLNDLIVKHPEYKKWMWPQDSTDFKKDVDWESYHKMLHE